MELVSDQDLRSELLSSLTQRHGLWVGGKDLVEVLGFKSQGSMLRAANRGVLALQLFPLPGRPGLFVLTTDLVDWILAARRRASAASPTTATPERKPIDPTK